MTEVGHELPLATGGFAVGYSMAKAQLSAHDIQAEVARRIHQLPGVRAASALIEVPLPELRPMDGTGLNWWMSGFGNALGFEEDIRMVVAEVAEHWNLAG